MDEEQKYLEEKHNRGVIINDDNEDWGGCPSTYEEEQLVPPAGLEPARLIATDFKSVVSTISTKEAYN